jgi:hypothetical protein
MAADDRPVAFINAALLELSPELAGYFTAQAKEQNAGGTAIQSMGRPDALADLIAQNLDGKARFVTVDFRTVDEQARWFVDDDDVLVAIENREFFSQKNVAWRRPEFPCR